LRRAEREKQIGILARQVLEFRISIRQEQAVAKGLIEKLALSGEELARLEAQLSAVLTSRS
jgi:hypothetical protein